MTTGIELWILFIVMVVAALAIDLGLKSHRHRESGITLGEAARWTALWVGLALVFAGIVYAIKGPQRGLEFLTGYLVEESLSVDNMFVFVLIFQFFKIAAAHQPRVLKWGIVGAVVMRFILIFAGVSLLARFHWIMYIFGGLLVITAIKLLISEESEMDPGQNKVLKLFERFVPVTAEQHGQNFFIRAAERWQATPLFATLLVVEASDLVFAMDSIPAVLAISNDPFIVFSSNIFAILGLRALFFLVSGFLGLFRFLRYGLAVVLIFIGTKMLLSDVFPVPILVSLAVVGGVLLLSVAASLLWKEKK